MNISFLIDKSQTFQMIAEILLESSRRGYYSTVYSFCNKDVLNFSDLDSSKNINFLKFSNLNDLIECHRENRDKFDASVGINFFNERWHNFYKNNPATNYALEYCWNELYKSHNSSVKDVTLFCNSKWTHEKIKEIGGHDNITFLGSPWFQFIKRFKSDKRKGYAVFMAPHDQYFLRHKNFSDRFLKIVKIIRLCCNSLGIDLILKSRRKFSQNYEKLGLFDSAVYDDSTFEHLTLFSNSSIVFNFCSSAVNELSFVETPFICLFPDLHLLLRDYEKDTFKAMQLINKKYYHDIFDNIHCAGISTLEINEDKLLEKINYLTHSQKDWSKFQNLHFPGNHDRSAARILDYIGERT